MANQDEEQQRDNERCPGFEQQLTLEQRELVDALANRWFGSRCEESDVVLRNIGRRGRWGHDDGWQRRFFRSQRKGKIQRRRYQIVVEALREPVNSRCTVRHDG